MKKHREKLQFDDLIDVLLDKLPQELFQNSTSTFLDLSCSAGQITRKIEQRLLKNRHSLENIHQRIFGIERYQILINYIKNKHNVSGTYVWGDVFKSKDNDALLKLLEDKYDAIISNPLYIKPAKNATVATAGDTSLYKRFYHLGKTLLKPYGILSFITPKGIIKELLKDDLEILYINLMSETEDWDVDTCYFSVKNSSRAVDYVFTIEDDILDKIYIPLNPRWRQIRKLPKSSKDVNGVKAISKLSSLKTGIEYDYINPLYKGFIPEGPKLCSNQFFSKHNFIVTDEPICAENVCVYLTDTLEDAERLREFVLKNRVFHAITKRLKAKFLFEAFKNIKEFDLKQIKTGQEIPKEWGLTETDIENLLKTQ